LRSSRLDATTCPAGQLPSDGGTARTYSSAPPRVLIRPLTGYQRRTAFRGRFDSTAIGIFIRNTPPVAFRLRVEENVCHRESAEAQRIQPSGGLMSTVTVSLTPPAHDLSVPVDTGRAAAQGIDDRATLVYRYAARHGALDSPEATAAELRLSVS